MKADPQSESRIRLRTNMAFATIMVCVVALGGWLVWVMIDRRTEALGVADTQHRRKIIIPARRGSILARTRHDNQILACSRQVPSCFADPKLLTDDEIYGVCVKLAKILRVDPMQLQLKIMRRREQRFVWLRREITRRQAEAIDRLGLRAIGIQYEWRRAYPAGAVAPTLIGWRRIDGVPGGGLEMSMDHVMGADDGKQVVVADAARRPLRALTGMSTPPRDGNAIHLTIDVVIQGYLQDALADAYEKYKDTETDETWVTGVVVRPSTGEILAMASMPNFDPNDFSRPGSSRTNRAITLPYEPGSIAKPIFSAAAVNAGKLRWSDSIDCEQGRYRAHRGGTITDHGHHYGRLTLKMVNVRSSNIGMAKVGEMCGNEMLYKVARDFGFGQETGIRLPGESRGQLRPVERWDGYSLRRVPFGQEISCTALQMTMAFSALANGGKLMKPILVDRITDGKGTVYHQSEPTVVRQVIRPEVSRQALEVMRLVVDDDHGTGKRCRMDNWTSFGKTGTAQVVGRDPADGVYRYLPRKFTASFIGGAPASDPELVCLVSVYCPDYSKGHYGGTVATPYVRRVLENSLNYLGVPHDKPDRYAAQN